jgi:hypothetical protein
VGIQYESDCSSMYWWGVAVRPFSRPFSISLSFV